MDIFENSMDISSHGLRSVLSKIDNSIILSIFLVWTPTKVSLHTLFQSNF